MTGHLSSQATFPMQKRQPVKTGYTLIGNEVYLKDKFL